MILKSLIWYGKIINGLRKKYKASISHMIEKTKNLSCPCKLLKNKEKKDC